jgi:hypothetical protein
MKTALLLPDELFGAAEALAERLGVAQSQLYVTDLARFLAEQEHEAIRERLNKLDGDAPEAAGDAAEHRGWLAMQVRSLRGDGGAEAW